LVSFFNSVNAFATASSIVGSLIGFIAGLYIPIGVLPSYLQTVIKVFPVSHSAMLLRQVFVEPVISKYMSGMPEAVTKLKAVMGIAFYAGDKQIPTFLSFLILLVSTVLFFVLASLRLSRKQK
ncbi:MAG TPA: ABC transporter permease, partial [Clostridiales bacterium]|nr:ABC transporter permease [Clostridiales bacterium]